MGLRRYVIGSFLAIVHGGKEEERQETINEDPAAQGCISNSHGR